MDYKIFEIDTIDEIKNLDFSVDNVFRIKYTSNYFNYNLLVKIDKTYEQLVVLSNGAVDHNKKTPPVFMRRSWIDEIDANLVFVDDGTIHDTDLSLGWGQGNAEEFVLEKYNEIILLIKDMMKIEDGEVTYFGSSAGGFMSLILSSMHRHSNALINNPQTIVQNYYEGLSGPLLKMAYREESLEKFKYRINVAEAFKYYDYVPKAYYIQNQLCFHDVNKHVNPFKVKMKELGLSLEPIIFINYYDEKSGHSPVSDNATLNYLNLLIKKDIF